MRLILQFLIISIGCIKRRCRIMSEYPVLRYHRSGDRLGIFIKQAVVSHTQSDDNVQVRLRMVQHLRLKDRVAHIDSDLVAALRNPNVRFGRGACLTGNPEYCKAALAEDRRQSPALLQEPHAGSDADLLRPDSLPLLKNRPGFQPAHPDCLRLHRHRRHSVLLRRHDSGDHQPEEPAGL